MSAVDGYEILDELCWIAIALCDLMVGAIHPCAANVSFELADADPV